MAPKSNRKRAAGNNEPSTSSANGTHKQKRTRFASPGSDPANFEEQVDATLENPSAARKGRVKTEGYDSDSSDDGEGVVESRKKATKQNEDEDDDMFALGEKEDTEEKDGGKKKEKEFLRLGDIEGQEFADEKTGHGSTNETSSEDEPEDEDDAERRRKAGMGYELSSFNMREEMEEGKFDADGTFLRTFDPHGVHDRWMEGVDEREIKKARRNKKMREREEKERIKKEEDDAVDKEDAEKELVGYLRRGETVLEALQRLGVAAKKDKSKRHATKKPLNTMDIDQGRPPSATSIQDSITRITDLASILMSQGNTDIYSSQYEQLLRSVRAAANVPPDWVPPSQNVQYEYRWALPEQDQNQDEEQPQVYGPYQPEEMLAWHGAKYFGDEGEKVRVRKLGENGWHEWDELMF
ncbi:hypothetical protein K439DRAFT_1619998 [Ramaria rubella]|nr:hypothetical protein K439DRAFT_1619998 [Ramaria rubella]